MFAVWLTGLPGSGKSTLAAELRARLQARGLQPAVLEFDLLRRRFALHATASEEERMAFYEGVVDLAEMFTDRGIPVLIDATAHRRLYRDAARARLARFLEVHVDCPPPVCRARHPSGVAAAPFDPAEYEPPLAADVHVRTDREDPAAAAARIVDALVLRGFCPAPRHRHD